MTDPKPRKRSDNQLFCLGAGRTKQSMKDECDINILMKRYQNSGTLPRTNPYPANYGDFSNIDDYQSSLNQVLEAQNSFRDLPSDVRGHFNNDPQQLLEFIQNPENLEEGREMGIIAQAIPVPTPTPPVTEPVTTPPPRRVTTSSSLL